MSPVIYIQPYVQQAPYYNKKFPTLTNDFIQDPSLV